MSEPVHFHKPVEAREKGIEIVYQDLALCDNLTAAANVFLGAREVNCASGRSSFSTSARCMTAPASFSPS